MSTMTSSHRCDAKSQTPGAKTPDPSGGLFGSIKMGWKVVFGTKRGATHQERIEAYYQSQASFYNESRKRILHGRKELWEQLPVPDDGVWIDFGGGTASNFEFLGESIGRLSKVTLVDLSDTMLKMAREHIARNAWDNVTAVKGDATCYEAPMQVDIITFSYALTMIPNWFDAIDNAFKLLKPGGRIGVVDFYVSRKYAKPFRQHSWLTRNLGMFGRDINNIFVSPDHLPYLAQRFETENLCETFGKFASLPLFRTPYYRFIGRKPMGEVARDDGPERAE